VHRGVPGAGSLGVGTLLLEIPAAAALVATYVGLAALASGEPTGSSAAAGTDRFDRSSTAVGSLAG
jgi:hypothetical protein